MQFCGLDPVELVTVINWREMEYAGLAILKFYCRFIPSFPAYAFQAYLNITYGGSRTSSGRDGK